MAVKREEWFFIVNPRAGSGKTMSKWIPAETALDALAIPYVTEYTSHKRHAMSLAREAAEKGFRKIIAVGGDGSIHEVINGICLWCDETGTPTEDFYFGVMPIGSGNDWIKSLNVPHDTIKVVNLIKKESFGQMDVVKVRGAGDKISYMANIGGVGFDSHVCRRVNMQKESGMRGKWIYLNALRHTLFHTRPIKVQVIADDVTVFKGEAYSIALGNGRYSGSGMRQVPMALNNDNILDFMIVPKIALTTLIKQIPRLFDGTVNESTDVITGRCTSLEIVPLNEKSNDIFELDGEIEGRIPLLIKMENRKTNVIKG